MEYVEHINYDNEINYTYNSSKENSPELKVDLISRLWGLDQESCNKICGYVKTIQKDKIKKVIKSIFRKRGNILVKGEYLRNYISKDVRSCLHNCPTKIGDKYYGDLDLHIYNQPKTDGFKFLSNKYGFQQYGHEQYDPAVAQYYWNVLQKIAKKYPNVRKIFKRVHFDYETHKFFNTEQYKLENDFVCQNNRDRYYLLDKMKKYLKKPNKGHSTDQVNWFWNIYMYWTLKKWTNYKGSNKCKGRERFSYITNTDKGLDVMNYYYRIDYEGEGEYKPLMGDRKAFTNPVADKKLSTAYNKFIKDKVQLKTNNPKSVKAFSNLVYDSNELCNPFLSQDLIY